MAAMEKTEQPLIAYADFSDYLPIIERGDNRNRIFKAVFNYETDVQVSFIRLYPIRICTMQDLGLPERGR
jgi:hypothetical protein